MLGTPQPLRKTFVQQMNDLRSYPGPLSWPSRKDSTFIFPLTSAPFNRVTRGKGAPGHGGRGRSEACRGIWGHVPFAPLPSHLPPLNPKSCQLSASQGPNFMR